MSKWTSKYWSDLGERVVATFLGALVTMLTADASGAVSGNAQQWWLIVGLPTVLALLKGLLANLGGGDNASMADVSVSGNHVKR